MATVTLRLDKRSKKSDGTFPVKLYIHHKGDIMLSTGVSVKEEEWLGDESNPTTVKYANRHLINMLIAAKSIILNLLISGRIDTIKSSELKKMIKSNDIEAIVAKIERSAAGELEATFMEFITLKSKPRTKDIYAQTLSKIKQLYNIEGWTLESLTVSWLREFESILRDSGIAVNSIAIHLRNIRAVYNYAIDEDVVSLNKYPFRKYKIKTERTIKRSLSVEQLRELRDYECQEYQQRYRDYFMLIFYLIGINMVDLASLQNINTGRIEYRRAKTGRLYSIKIEDEALKIINKYKGKKFLMDVLDTNTTHSRFLKQANEALQAIGGLEWVENAARNPKDVKKNKKKVTPLFPDITTYWARHTWATIAASLDIPKETIAAALGHGGNTVTDIYIDFDQRKVDDANRRVIDFVNQITTTPCEEK